MALQALKLYGTFEKQVPEPQFRYWLVTLVVTVAANRCLLLTVDDSTWWGVGIELLVRNDLSN